jgi:hypothetical protein
VIVPSDSVIARANGLSIAIVQDGVVHIRKISIGRDYGAQTEVLSGVNSGDMVAINPTDAVQDGAKVKAHELKQGPQAGGATSGQQSSGGQNQPDQPKNRQRNNQQNVQPLNPEKNVPLSKGVEPGAPGDLQGPGPIIHPQPDYGVYDTAQPGQAPRSGNPKANSAAPGSTGSSSTSSQPH